MGVDERIRERLLELVAMGQEVLGTRRSPGSGVIGDDRVDSQLASQWLTSTQNLLARVFGIESEHYKNFVAQFGRSATYSPVYRAQGVLRAAHDDYERGYVFELRGLIEAEVFDSFLEQAEHLLGSGYFQAAAVMAGGVLEDGLRKLCDNAGIEAKRPKLDTMNADLAKAGVYSKLVQKRITTLADLRNKAAHGKWDEFTSDDVAEMVTGVRRLVEEHLG